jgi:hypothetical protein
VLEGRRCCSAAGRHADRSDSLGGRAPLGSEAPAKPSDRSVDEAGARHAASRTVPNETPDAFSASVPAQRGRVQVPVLRPHGVGRVRRSWCIAPSENATVRGRSSRHKATASRSRPIRSGESCCRVSIMQRDQGRDAGRSVPVRARVDQSGSTLEAIHCLTV